MTYLALSVGSSSVTAAVWSPSGLVSVASSPLAVDASARDLWSSVETAVLGLSADLVEVEAVGCAGTASYVLLSADGEPLSPLLSVVPASVGDGWIASARDFVASLLTGRLATDPTVASATGFFHPDGTGADPRADRVPPQRGSTEVLGDLLLPAARRLGLRTRLPVVTGATAETCAVEGAGALPVAPLVTFGSPVVVSVPVEPPAADPPSGVSLRAGGRSYQVYEAAVPCAVSGADAAAADAAAAAPLGDPARAAYETASFTIAALVSELAPDAKFVYAGGVADRAWRAVLPSVTGLPLVHRRSPEVTTLGLAMLTATGVGAHLDRDAANPVAYVDEPDLDLAGRYAALR